MKIYKYQHYIPNNYLLNLPTNYIFNDKLIVFNGLTSEQKAVDITNKSYHTEWTKLMKSLSNKTLKSTFILINEILVDYTCYELEEPNIGNIITADDSINYINANKEFYNENPIELTYKVPYHDTVPDEYDNDCKRVHGVTAEQYKLLRRAKILSGQQILNQ